MFKSIAVLALAGSAIARPAIEARALKTIVHTVVVTHTQVVTYTGEPKPASKAPVYTPVPQPKPAPSSKKEEVVVVTPTPKPSPAPAPKPSPSPAPAPAPAPASGYIGIVNKYRRMLQVNPGLKDLQQDAKLQSNAQNCVDESGGKMKHKLNPGSMAQVLAPGTCGDMVKFESALVGGWLCELPQLLPASICTTFKGNWNHAGQTGHAEILSNKAYTKIGCACAGDIWSCDLQ